MGAPAAVAGAPVADGLAAATPLAADTHAKDDPSAEARPADVPVTDGPARHTDVPVTESLSAEARPADASVTGGLSAAALPDLEDTPPAARREQAFVAHLAGGGTLDRRRDVPTETPVALEFNGIGYAVMMATPADLEDFVTGFAVAERLVAPGEALADIAVAAVQGGVIVRARLAGDATPVFERARRRVAESSCGLCGIDNLAEVNRALPPVARPLRLDPAALFAALADLPRWQPLGAATRAVHAAALCRPDGSIVLAREDVGRHNALDKAIGARARAGIAGDLFALVTARCSYELVEKAVLAGLGALVAISAPSTLALDRARAAGLPLYVLARPDAVLEA